jgi:hypothetical protein
VLQMALCRLEWAWRFAAGFRIERRGMSQVGLATLTVVCRALVPSAHSFAMANEVDVRAVPQQQLLCARGNGSQATDDKGGLHQILNWGADLAGDMQPV